MKAFIREKDVSFVFECVDREQDPHIIEYPENRLVLLDIVRNTLEYKKYGYEEMCAIAAELGLTPKKKAYEFLDWQEFSTGIMRRRKKVRNTMDSKRVPKLRDLSLRVRIYDEIKAALLQFLETDEGSGPGGGKEGSCQQHGCACHTDGK